MQLTAGLVAFLVCSTLAAIPSTNVQADQATPPNSRRAAATAAERARAVHVLNRLSFGPRPGEVDRVLAMGVDRWIDRQLRTREQSLRELIVLVLGSPAFQRR